jgi:hypothetical protein
MMNREDIIRMAKDAGYGLSLSDMHAPALERFAALVAAAEREECAKTIERARLQLGGQLFHGMTLRDYFAAQAMMHFCDFGALSDDEYFEQNALAAYKMADTMLKVRAV